MTLKKFSLQKIRYQKNAEFYVDSDTDDKNAKKFLTRKLHHMPKKCRKFEFVHFHYCLQKFWAKNYFCEHFFHILFEQV
jgi:hypothetical protein